MHPLRALNLSNSQYPLLKMIDYKKPVKIYDRLYNMYKPLNK